MKKACLVLLVLALAMAGCEPLPKAPAGEAADGGLKRYQGSFLGVFDTVTTVVLYDTNEAAAQERMAEIKDALTRYHRLYDIYHTYDGMANLRTINENAGVQPVQVDEAILDLLTCAGQMHALTGGRTNIAMGGVLSIWHSCREAGVENPEAAKLPPMEKLRAAAGHMDMDAVLLDRNAKTVYLADPEMRLDVGAIAKGYAAQRVADMLRAEGVTSLLLSIGGNVCGIGGRADGADWRVSVRSPAGEDSLCYVRINDRSLVTSGTYQRYYTVNGKRYAHIIDPATLMPADRFDSVSVLAKDSGMADALSTALCSMTLADGMALIDSLPDTEALWVDAGGKQTMSAGFAGYIFAEDE